MVIFAEGATSSPENCIISARRTNSSASAGAFVGDYYQEWELLWEIPFYMFVQTRQGEGEEKNVLKFYARDPSQRQGQGFKPQLIPVQSHEVASKLELQVKIRLGLAQQVMTD